MANRYVPAAVPRETEPPELRAFLDREFRKVAQAQPDARAGAILRGATSDVVANDTTETGIIGFAEQSSIGKIAANAVAGTISLPPGNGVARLICWVSLAQLTATRNFTVQLLLSINSAWQAPILSSGYIPQNGVSVRLGLSASFIRPVTGGEVLQLGLLLDGATPATFAIDNSTFEIEYLDTRG